MHCPCLRSLLALVLQLYAGQADLSWCQVHVLLMFYVCFKRVQSLILPLKRLICEGRRYGAYILIYDSLLSLLLIIFHLELPQVGGKFFWSWHSIIISIVWDYLKQIIGITFHPQGKCTKGATTSGHANLPKRETCSLSLVGQTGKRFVNNILLVFFGGFFISH